MKGYYLAPVGCPRTKENQVAFGLEPDGASGELHMLFLLFLLERPQKWKINVRKNLPSRFVNNIYA
jgi:hypothetical protein